MADVLGDQFFPANSSSLRLVESFCVFGSAFLMRPIGGIFVGYIGDTLGRKRALEISIAMMLLPSFLMGCLPTYSDWGGWATALLVILRLIQGLAVGGELVSAYVFCIESSPPGFKIFWGGITLDFANLGTFLGIVVAAIVRGSLSEADLQSYGWRICFWLGILVGISGVLLRRGMKDTEEFERVKKDYEADAGDAVNPVSEALESHWLEILQVSKCALIH